MSKDFLKIQKQTIIGMVHCLPLPGTAGYQGDMQKIIDQAVLDAITLEKAGVDAIMIENMGDGPFAATLDTAQVTALSAISMLIKQKVKLPIGIDAAFNDYETSISIALAIGGDFVRIPVFVDNVEFYGGYIYPCARNCMLYRKNLGAEHIKILADIQVKHTHMVLPHVTIVDSAKAAIDCGADAIIVTGTHIGSETPAEIIKKVKEIAKIPVIAGSGVNANNIKEQLSLADGAIIGSSLKKDGIISNPIDFDLVKKVVDGLK